ADENVERQLMDLRAPAHVMFGRVHVTAGMKTHVHAPHDLAGATRRVMLLDHLHLELHVLLESRRRAHGEVLRVELEADIDHLLKLNAHATPPEMTDTVPAACARCDSRTMRPYAVFECRLLPLRKFYGDPFRAVDEHQLP